MGGALLAFLLIKPPSLVPFIVVLAALRYWKVIVSLSLTACALVSLPVMIFGVAGLGGYFRTMVNALSWRSGQVGGFDPASTRSFAGFAQLLAPSFVSTAATVIFAISVLALLAIYSYRSPSIDLPWALAVVAALLISPHVLIHDLSLLLLPVLIGVRHASLGPAHLGALVAVGYVAVTIGFGISHVAPIQLSVLAEAALGIWFIAAMHRDPKIVIVDDSQPAAMTNPAAKIA
jgi:hypothetical protein